MRSWTPTKRSHSPHRRWPMSGCFIRHRFSSLPSMRSAARRMRGARLVEQRQQLLARWRRPVRGPTAHDRGLLLRPLPGGVERRPRRQEAARGGGMRERLGDVPVLLAARRAEQPFGQRAEHPLQLVADRLLLGEDARHTALLDAGANLAPQRLEPGQAPVRDAARRRRRRAPRPRGASAMERSRWSSRAALARGARSAPPAGRRPWRRRPPPRPGRACRTRRAP